VPLFIAGLFRDRGLADRVVTALLDAGVSSGEISLCVREEAEEDMTERDELSTEESRFVPLAVHSAWERLGWLSGARPAYRDVIAPDVEMVLLTAGPLAIGIGGAQVGATAGGVVGTMTNFGFTHDTARDWYARIVDGAAWIMVRTPESQAGPIRQVFERYRPELPAESLRHW
jgi:hypothetical protein